MTNIMYSERYCGSVFNLSANSEDRENFQLNRRNITRMRKIVRLKEEERKGRDTMSPKRQIFFCFETQCTYCQHELSHS